MELANEKKGILYCLYCLKEVLLTLVFYLNVLCIEYFFRVYILFSIKKHYFIHLLLVFKLLGNIFYEIVGSNNFVVLETLPLEHIFNLTFPVCVCFRHKLLSQRTYLRSCANKHPLKTWNIILKRNNVDNLQNAA